MGERLGEGKEFKKRECFWRKNGEVLATVCFHIRVGECVPVSRRGQQSSEACG